MPTRTYNGRIVYTAEDCSLHFDNDGYVYKDLKEAFKDQAKVSITIKTRHKQRSLRQNSVLHWYINEIAEETGMASDDIKEVLRHKFLSVDAMDKNGEIMADKSSGEVLKVYRSTTELSTVEMMTLLEEIRLWANDFLNLQLPLPNEDVELRFK